ncbi:MAG: energy transducer TonB [Sulfuricaulis sp.]
MRAFALGSVILHGVVLAGWQASPRVAGQANSVISVTLVSSPAGTAPAAPRQAELRTRKIAYRPKGGAAGKSAEASGANHGHARAMALLATSAKTEPTSMDSRAGDSRPMDEKIARAEDAQQGNARDTSDLTSPAAPATGEKKVHDQAGAQIQSRLYTDLARYFDYPYVARLRGWEGTVLLALNVESDGRLEGIHVARSSGYAVLDDSALSALRKVRRLTETHDLLPGRKMAMRIPVIYRLRCPDTQACRGNRLAAMSEDHRTLPERTSY